MNNFDLTISYFRAYDRLFNIAGFNLYETYLGPTVGLKYSYRLTEAKNLGFVVLLNDITIRSDITLFKSFDRSTVNDFYNSPFEHMTGIPICAPMSPNEYKKIWQTFKKNDQPMLVSEHRKSYKSSIEFKDQVNNNHPNIGERFCMQCHNPVSFLTGFDLSDYNNPEDFQSSEFL